MQRPAGPVAEEDHRRVDGRDEPQQHVHQVHPYGVLHADLPTLLRCRVCGDVNVSEDAEERGPEAAAIKLAYRCTQITIGRKINVWGRMEGRTITPNPMRRPYNS